MKAIQKLPSIIGWVVVVAYILGMFGLGNFRIYYGSDLPKEWCAKGQI